MQLLKSIGRTAKRQARSLHGYGSALTRSAPKISRDFVILAAGRVGSHLLIDLLNSHPDFHVDGEILHHNAVPKMVFPEFYLKGVRARSTAPIYGCKVSFGDLQRQQIDPAAYLKEFAENGGHIIYQHRRNFFRAAVSREIAHLRGIHRDKVENPLHGLTFQIDSESVLEQIQRRAARWQVEMETLRDIRHQVINYEDDLLRSEAQQETCDRIFQILGCDSKPVTTSYARRSPFDLSEVVRNYDELASAVERAGWSHFLTDIDYESRLDSAA